MNVSEVHPTQSDTQPGFVQSPQRSPVKRNNWGSKRNKQQKPYVRELYQSPRSSVALLAPRRSVWHYYVNTQGLPAVCNVASAIMQSRDRLMRVYLSDALLRYVTNICLLNRLVQANIVAGLRFPPDHLSLNAIASRIKLPPLLLRYIECVGPVDLIEGPTIVPTCPGNYQDLQTDHFYDHTQEVDLIARHINRVREGRLPNHGERDDNIGQVAPAAVHPPAVPPQPALEVQPAPVTEWRIREDFVSFYISNSRAHTLGLQLRPVQFEEVGRAEALVCCDDTQANTFSALCARQVPEEQALAGAAFCYRNNDPATWVDYGGNACLKGEYFTSHSYSSRELYLSDMMIKSLNFQT